MNDNLPTQTKDPSLYRLPPQSIEAEEALLSSVLIDNSTLYDILDILIPDDFYKPSHQKIFAAVVALNEQNEPVDLVTLATLLKERGLLKEVGGAAYLARLVDTIPVAANAVQYAKIIHGKAALRFLIEKSNAIVKRCFEDRGDVEAVIDYAEQAIFDISEKKINPAFLHISSIIESIVDEI